jgi:ATP-dependent metalloprotease
MVKEWGMSEKVGFRTIEQSSGSLVVVNDLSPQTAELIDSEIKRILQVINDSIRILWSIKSKRFIKGVV